MYQRTYIGNAETYSNLAKQYLSYLFMSEERFELVMKPNKYTTERYMIIFENGGQSGFVVIYDFKLMKGHLIMFDDNSKFEYRITEITGAYDSDWLVVDGNSLVLIGVYDEKFSDDYHYFQDDPIEDTGYEFYEYFDIINDGDDETVLSQLNASLMKLSRVMHL